MNKLSIPLFVLIWAFSFTHSVSAQVERVVYQTFVIQESSENLNFNIKDNYEIIGWNHENDIMIESTIQLKGGSMDLLKTFINEGRYLIVPKPDSVETIVQLNMPKDKRQILKLHDKELEEIVTHRIYIPIEFLKVSDELYSRKTETILVTKN
jgi:hypothetical protein